MTGTTDLAHVIPLSNRRGLARAILAAPFVLVAAGIVAVAIAGRDSAWAALLSAGLPGLGQLVQGRWIAGAVMLLLFVFCLAYWHLRSGLWTFAFLIPIAAIDAAVDGAWWAVLAGIGVGLVLAVSISVVNGRWRAHRERKLAAAIASVEPTGRPGAHVAPIETVPSPPPDRNEEAFLRYLLTFGHAAPDNWSVFDDPKHVDSALRYQMNLASWALYVYQHRRTPAYREAYSTSLGNFAERCRDHRVWDYTPKLMLKAFKLQRDPFGYENVMYSGYANEVIGAYEAMSGDHRYDEPGGYTLRDERHTYEWNHRQIVDRLAEQFGTDPFGTISCVPGWIWPPCQAITLRGMLLADQVHGTDHEWVFERFAEGYRNTFVDDDNKIVTQRSNLGMQQILEPFLLVPAQAGTGVMLAGIDANLVTGHFEKYVKSRMEPPDADGRIRMNLRALDQYDTSYGTNAGLAYSMCLMYASEIGDTETAAGLRRTIEDMCTPDEARPGPGSIVSIALMFLALTNGERGLAAAHRQVPSHATTPELGSAPYPQVMVTEARFDGARLACTLVPGPEANGQVELRFDRLDPGRSYALTGAGETATLTADPEGHVRAKVASSARQSMVLTPAS
jgi:hypothetical protein